jgi:superfamily II DNA or RNA helicase
VRDGLLSPEDVEKRQRRLAQQWIPPMSYRQFSNVVQGKNPIYEVLKKRNGKTDPLKKTLIIIDEAHKLYSSDFKGAEKPDVPAFMAALQNSYAVSGPESARVLLMTATPYNESPMELMSLLNLCRIKEDHLPTELGKFAEKYMDVGGNFTEEGLLEYMNAVAGQISYLNREADPSQFAQPILHEVVVPISTYDDVNPGDNEELVALQKDAAELEAEKINLEDEVIPHLQTQIELFGPALESKQQECSKLFVGKPKDLKGCLTRVNKTYKDGLKFEERNLREAIKRVDKIGKEFNKLKKKSVSITKKLKKTGIASLTQQAQLETRCKIGI